MDTTHKREYRVRDLSTKSVTLFPTRAQVVREIKDVVLKPGANEITVVGVTPTADEHSIKVEGTGSAIITDITVELLPNRDIFEEIYPDSDDEDDKKSDDESDDEPEKVNEALDAVRDKIQAVLDEQKIATETVANAGSRLKILDAYGASLDKKRAVDIQTSLDTYRTEREKVFEDHLAGTIRDRELAKDLRKLRAEETRLVSVERKAEIKAKKAKLKVLQAKRKIQEKERRRKDEALKEKKRIRKEREAFWPRQCYSVRITLDAASFTPSSSRRSSIASASDIVKVVAEKESPHDDEGSSFTCDLTLSYVTSSAFWSPSYDLALSTTTNTALLCFDARLTNMTSETWANSKVILSTSQTTFSGLQDVIPTLVPWRVKLAGKWNGGVQTDIIASKEEQAMGTAWREAQNAGYIQKPRAWLFGVSDQPPYQENVGFNRMKNSAMPQQQQMQVQAMSNNVYAPKPCSMPSAPAAGPFGAANSIASANLFGSSARGAMDMKKQALGSMAQSSAAPMKNYRKGGGGGGGDGGDHGSGGSLGQDSEDEDDGDTFLEPTPELDFQESAFEETGLTATYDLPNLKTLRPSSTASKQRVARISFTNVYFSHTVVAKYKPAAYLKAKLRNTSKLTLLKGSTGLTLDGTFMGRSSLPRCSAGDTFTMSLGVDPAIKVAYPKPDIKRSTTGVFTKGDNSVYTRTITLVNSRATAGKPVNITVLDQVPVSEDEKLRVDLLHPRISSSGAVSTGQPGKEGKDEKDWGRASATLKKQGEVSWDVVLNAGRSARLTLEYEVAFPTGERVVQV